MKDLLTGKYKKGAMLKVLPSLVIFMAAFVTPSVHAAEGGIGRPITGAQVLPLSAILPVEEGWIFSLSSVYYRGKINNDINIGGQIIKGGLDYRISYNLFSFLNVWKTTERWSFGSSFSIPVQYVGMKTRISGARGSLGNSASSTKIGDLTFSPFMANYRISDNSYVLFNLQAYAPTGSYEKGKIDNVGLNVWTLVPSVAYTTILPKTGTEFTGVAALEIYSPNDKTKYHNGDIFRLDLLALQRLGNGWGLGLVGGWIYQTESDKSRLSDLAGIKNKGRAVGVGLLVSYETKYKDKSLSFSMRWIKEFDVRDRPKGDGLQFSITAVF